MNHILKVIKSVNTKRFGFISSQRTEMYDECMMSVELCCTFKLQILNQNIKNHSNLSNMNINIIFSTANNIS